MISTKDLATAMRSLAKMERDNGIECNALTLEDTAARLETLNDTLHRVQGDIESVHSDLVDYNVRLPAKTYARLNAACATCYSVG